LKQRDGGFHNLQIWVSLENRKAYGSMNWAHPSGTVAWVNFKSTVPHTSPIGTWERDCAMFPPDW
jgi:hypothetical protein